ncbi:MAG TPA: cellulose synthase operon protein YhjQ/BcsQ [Acidobacteriaceae bacterium]|nr:cellulose synthase operon protein YhjQ/BcsQ [Acidobacteriaceae bacterium]
MKPDENARNAETTEQADDVATLYSWANLHGAKYRDFSASRQEMRAQMRQRTLSDRARIAREEARNRAPALGEGPRWEDLLPDSDREAAAGAAAPPRRENFFEPRVEKAAEPERRPTPLPPLPETSVPTRHGLGDVPYFRDADFREAAPDPHPVERIGEGEGGEVRPAWLTEITPPPAPAFSSLPPAAPLPPAPPVPAAAPPAQAAHPFQTPHAFAAQPLPQHQPAAPAVPPPSIEVPESDSLTHSRERVASRWFALRGVFGRNPEELQPAHAQGQVPVLTFFSLAGGVGKTSLAAAIGRALAARGERVLLTDTCSFGVLPFYFGAREIKPGVVRTFSGGTSDPPIRVLTLEAERYDADPDLLRREMTRGTHDVSRVLIDVATGSAPMLRQAARLSPVIVVPVVPDMASVVTLPVLEGFFRNQEGLHGKPLQAWYVLNQFDPSSPLHLDVREVLRQQLGERLLPFAVHRSPAMSEALAEGMTVIDYAPSSPASEDIMSMVTWIRNTSVAAGTGQRGVRWSER